MQSVKHFMVDSGWNQADLALALGVNYSYASLILSGKRIPSVAILRKLAEVTHIPVGKLMEEAGKQPPRRPMPESASRLSSTSIRRIR